MTYFFDHETEFILSTFLKNLHSENKIYMVGGVVRDILLDIPVHDIDFSFCGNVREYSKRVADELKASFFMLNEKYQTARIIYVSETGKKRWIDIVAMRENDILVDLHQRDFTINAMAIDLQNREKIIDPLGGAKDLKHKKIELCNPESIENDPVRILRAVRLAVQFGWKISTETINAIKNSSQKLSVVTSERKRDELFRIFDLEDSYKAIRILFHFGLLKYCIPALDGKMQKDETIYWENIISSIKRLSQFHNLIIGNYRTEGASDFFEGEVVLYLGRFRKELSNYFQKRIHTERNLQSLMVCSMLTDGMIHNFSSSLFFTDLVKRNPDNKLEVIEKVAEQLVLSSDEKRWIVDFFAGLEVIESSVREPSTDLNPEFSFTFFNRSKQAGIAACLYCLAFLLSIEEFDNNSDKWKRCLEINKFLFDAYFNHYNEWINPTNYVNGHEIKKILKIDNGKKIGYWIYRLKIETINGRIKSHKDAINFLVTQNNLN